MNKDDSRYWKLRDFLMKENSTVALTIVLTKLDVMSSRYEPFSSKQPRISYAEITTFVQKWVEIKDE